MTPLPTPTLAVVIGVTDYLDESIESLPAAQVDAVRFARAIRNWGIPESHIFLFLNAQKKEIDDFFEYLSEREESYKLLFYFSGHGYREASSVPKSYLLFSDSNTRSNFFSLDSAIEKINKLNTTESYILIDACYVRINSLLNPKLEEEIKGQKISRKSFFCLLSSGVQESFESEKEQYGYFTEALLHSLCKIRSSEGSPTQLLSDICKEMEAKGLPLPEMYNIGSQKISFISPAFSSAEKSRWVPRHAFVAKIQDALIQQRGKTVCLIGESGSGKSVIGRLLESEKLKTIYLSFPHLSSKSFDPIDYLALAIKERFRGIFSESASSDLILHQFGKRFPFYLVILDQLERVSPEQLNRLLSLSLRMQFLFISNQSISPSADQEFRKNLVYLEAAPFSYAEGEALIKKILPDCFEKECALIHSASQGNPAKMRKIALSLSKPTAFESGEMEEGLKKAIAAIFSTGFYIDEPLFIKTFNLNETSLSFLKEIGLITHTENGWIPHEYFLSEFQAEEVEIDAQATLDYWCQQIEETPQHVQAAKSLILSVKCFGYQEKVEHFLKMAFYALYPRRKEHLSDFIDGAEIFLSLPKMTETTIFLAEIFLELREFERAYSLLNMPATSEEQSHRARLCQAQGFWRMGRLQESIVLCSEFVEKIKDSSLITHCHFTRGVAHFLKGNWEESLADFTKIYKNSQESHYVGRAQCMLGTILGIRGIDFQRGKEYLESGTRLLVKLKDISGAWMGWNNLGEIFWRHGEYKTASFYLEKALESFHGHEGAQLETLRNLLHLHLRMSGPFSKSVSDLLLEIDSLNWNQSEFFVRMQMYNALSTAYIFRKNNKQALYFLKRAITDTAKHAEHHIYTQANLSLFYHWQGKEEKSKAYLNKTLALAKKGNNPLAVARLENDLALLR